MYIVVKSRETVSKMSFFFFLFSLEDFTFDVSLKSTQMSEVRTIVLYEKCKSFISCIGIVCHETCEM